jgi:hypothetical protein
MELFAVVCDCETISVWTDYIDAEADAGERRAMDFESSYHVETITERELPDFWLHNPQLFISSVF